MYIIISNIELVNETAKSHKRFTNRKLPVTDADDGELYLYSVLFHDAINQSDDFISAERERFDSDINILELNVE